jgi:hypothetical protein
MKESLFTPGILGTGSCGMTPVANAALALCVCVFPPQTCPHDWCCLTSDMLRSATDVCTSG